MIRRVGVGLIALAAASGCASADEPSETPGELSVFAASSLTEAFTEMAEAFERDRDGLDVRLTFGGSGSLARQLGDGAQADVFASADEIAMESLGDAVGAPAVIAKNRLVIVVEPGNPKHVKGLESLSGDIVLVVCAPEVPCGRYADAALERAGVTVQPASREENVKAVVARVALGEADAGIVYATDAIAAGEQVARVDIGADVAPDASYTMAVVEASESDLADDWLRFVLSQRGQDILERHGFLAP